MDYYAELEIGRIRQFNFENEESMKMYSSSRIKINQEYPTFEGLDIPSNTVSITFYNRWKMGHNIIFYNSISFGTWKMVLI